MSRREEKYEEMLQGKEMMYFMDQFRFEIISRPSIFLFASLTRKAILFFV